MLHAQATEKDSTGMIDYTEFCEILQVRHCPDRRPFLALSCLFRVRSSWRSLSSEGYSPEMNRTTIPSQPGSLYHFCATLVSPVVYRRPATCRKLTLNRSFSGAA